eukprot:5644968-Pyramimonas_sp.AAC.1
MAVVSWYRLLYDYTIPKSMRSPREGPINQSHIPYIYPTVKLKCWCGGFQTPPDGRHRCSKPQYSCFRTICSFVCLPSRALYRSVSRAFTLLSNQFNPGWSFLSLDTAVPSVLDQCCHLVSAPTVVPPLCRGCSQPVRLPGVLVGDAGQACEAIDVARILDCLDRLFSKVEAHRCITVLRTQRSHAYFGGHINQRLWDRT